MRAILALLPFVLLVAACRAEGTVEVRVRSTPQPVTETEPAPPPDPTPEVMPQLNAIITEIAVHVDRPNIDLNGTDNDESNGWTTIFEGDQHVNLLDSSAVAQTLGTAPAPVGTVTQVRLYLAEDVKYVDARGQHAVTCPSCTQTGLKLVTGSNVEVDEVGILRLTLRFDGEESLIKNAEGLMLKPVVHVEAATYLK